MKNLEELNCQNKYLAQQQLIPELPSFVCVFAIAFLRQKQYEGLTNLQKIECYIYLYLVQLIRVTNFTKQEFSQLSAVETSLFTFTFTGHKNKSTSSFLWKKCSNR